MPASVKDVVEKYERLSASPVPREPARNDSPARFVHPLLRTGPLPARTDTAIRPNGLSRPSRSTPLSLPHSSYYISVTTPPVPPPSRELTTVTLSHSPSVPPAASTIPYVSSSHSSSSLLSYVSRSAPSSTPLRSNPPRYSGSPSLSSIKEKTSDETIEANPDPGDNSSLPHSPDPSLRSISTPSSLPAHSTHTPIPSSEVFSKNAATLFLPSLDKVFEQLSAPVFTPIPRPSLPEKPNSPGIFMSCRRKATPSSPSMFPPLHELSKGKSLVDLTYNSAIIAPWKNRANIFNFLSSMFLGIAGSSIAGTFYSLTGIYDSLQVFALVLSTIVPNAGKNLGPSWRKLFLGTIPNIIAFNIFPLLTQKILFLTFMTLISLVLVYYFHRATREIINPTSNTEGIYRSGTSRSGSGWGVVLAGFILIVLYLPMSTIAVHGLVWSSDFWPTNNTIASAGTNSSMPDVCFTTSIGHDSTNFAPAVIVMCVATVVVMTLYFPFRLSVAIKKCLPSVDQYTELGRRRSSTEMELEYQRRLDRDTNPFSYHYNDYRRRWGTYKSIYLFVKLAALLIVALADPSNCLMRSVPARTALLIRQAILVLVMAGFWVLQSLVAPYLDPINNASEWVSRASYTITAGIGVVGVSGASDSVKKAFEGPFLYVVYMLTYGLNIYFAVIHWSWVQRIVKRIARRIDFSIDIFSPHLDISPSSLHIRRRIWQETITTMFLTHPDTRMPANQKMIFVEAPESEWPPYLLGYQGSPAERHVENIKILRELGGESYNSASAQNTGLQMRAAFEHINGHLVGPDAYWAGFDHERKIDSRWGNAWSLPFPPTVVIRFDNGGFTVLSNLRQFETFIHQNLEHQVVSGRQIRRSLRCLENQIVFWPYSYTEVVGSQNLMSCGGGRYRAVSTTHFELGRFIIQRRGKLLFDDYIDLGSGFDIYIKYSPKVTVDGSLVGLSNEFILTPMLASFLALNEHLIRSNLNLLSGALRRYREHLRLEAVTKRHALSYVFLSEVFEVPASPEELLARVKSIERDSTGSLTQMLQDGLEQGALTGVDERMKCVMRSSATTWWYLFWDDFWRRNHATITALRTHETDFNPYYPTSIAYRPLPRAILDAFLIERGLLTAPAKGRLYRRAFIHTGILNKMYFRLNQIVFPKESPQAIHIYVGGKPAEDVDLADIDHDRATTRLSRKHERLFSVDTGGGTDHDDTEIRERPEFTYEGVFDDPVQPRSSTSAWRPWGKFPIWFGITPFARTRYHSRGIAFDLTLDNIHHRYVRS